MAVKFNTKEKAASELGIKPIAQYNNFVIGEILSIAVEDRQHKPTPKTTNYQFDGMLIPNLVIRFKQKKDSYNKDNRFATLAFKPVVTIKKDKLAQKEGVVDNIIAGQYDHMKHFLDTFEGLPGFVGLTELGYDLDGKDAQGILDEMRAFYNTIVLAFNKEDGTPIYKDETNPVEIVAKFICNSGTRYLSFPDYVNKGYLEIAKFDAKGALNTTLEFYGDTIEIPEKATTSAMPGGAPNAMPGAQEAVDLNII